MDITVAQDGSRKQDKERTLESGANRKSIGLPWSLAENGSELWMPHLTLAESRPGVNSNAAQTRKVK